jgi:hypothetical protein
MDMENPAGPPFRPSFRKSLALTARDLLSAVRLAQQQDQDDQGNRNAD